MFKKVITNGEDQVLMQQLLLGASEIATPVAVTFGPWGHNVIIEKGGYPIVTKDGVTVAVNVLPSDPVKRQAALIIRQAAQQTVKEAGDGTSSSCILAYAILIEAANQLQDGNVFALVREIKEDWKSIDKYLEKSAITHDDWDTTESFEVLKSIATLSANNDEELGEIIARAVQWAGADGLVTTKVSESPKTHVELKAGVLFESGVLSQAYYTDHAKKIAAYDNPLFVLIDDKVDKIDTLMPFINEWQTLDQLQTQCLVFVVSDMLGDAMTSILRNRIKSGMAFLVVKASHFQNQRREVMKDLQVVTGAAHVYGVHTGIRPKDFTDIAQFGKADRVICTDKEMFIMPSANRERAINNRAAELSSRIEDDEDDEFTRKRIAALKSAISVIHVGGTIAGEAEERMMRVDDARRSAQASLKHGFYPGGGIMYLAASVAAKTSVMQEALQQPIYSLIQNMGLIPDPILEELEKDFIKNVKEYDDLLLPVKSIDFMGIYGEIGSIVDASKLSVYDSALVVRTALKNAVAAACLLITTGAIIIDSQNSDNE